MGDMEKTIKIESLHATRTMAFYLLYAANRQDYTIPLEDLIQIFREGFNLEYSDDLFEIEISHGVLEHKNELDEYIKPLLQNWNFNRLGCCTKIILRMAIWELKYKKTLHQIVIDEAIELAKDFAEKDAYKFINGILDEIYKNHFKKNK